MTRNTDTRIREVVLDTETTGLDPAAGDRIVEIGAMEMLGHVPTGRTFHVHINPECEVGADAVLVHGLTGEFLADKPVFAEIVEDFLGFIGEAKLVIHNAAFDMGFLNAELTRAGHAPLEDSRAIDTLAMARAKFPGSRASLDALCARFNIDNSHRQLHGAMVDTDLLARVYIELLGGRQMGLGFGDERGGENKEPGDSHKAAEASLMPPPDTAIRAPRPHSASEEELRAHADFIAGLKNPLWQQ